MEQLKKSLELLEKYFNETPEHEVKATLDYYNNIESDGVTWNAYIDNFEKEFENLYLYELDIPIVAVDSSRDNWDIGYLSNKETYDITSIAQLVQIENLEVSEFYNQDIFGIAA